MREIAVVIPVYISKRIQKRYLTKCIRSLKSSSCKINLIAVSNFVADHLSIDEMIEGMDHLNSAIILQGRQPQSVAKAWNDGIKRAVLGENEYILILNQDVIMRSDSIDNLVAFADKRTDAVLWTMTDYRGDEHLLEDFELDDTSTENPNFSGFMIQKGFFERFGSFDEHFDFGYFEDNDMHARIAMSGCKAVNCGLARMFHKASLLRTSDREFDNSVHVPFRKNKTYFQTKWGSQILNEAHEMRMHYNKTPFNDPTKTLKDW